MGDWNAEDLQHNYADDCGRNNWDDKYRHDGPNVFRHRNALDQLDHISGEQADEQRAKKASLDLVCEISADEAGYESRFAGYGIRNVPGKHRQHQGERGRAYIEN